MDETVLIRFEDTSDHLYSLYGLGQTAGSLREGPVFRHDELNNRVRGLVSGDIDIEDNLDRSPCLSFRKTSSCETP